MPIIQISKVQQRSGNLVDLPQLDNAQFGWAYDQNRLFIGRSGPNVTTENIEVLTSYSNLSFSQIDGSAGSNIYITSPTTGQVLAYDSSLDAFVNAGGASTANINLGNVSNVTLGGGAVGYVLETNGSGGLSWTPKSTVVANIVALSNATPIIMTVANTTPYTNKSQITIAGVNGDANSNVNSQIFYVKVAVDYPTSGNVELYTDPGLDIGNAAIGTGLTYTNSPNATATTAIVNTGIAYAQGSNNSVQFNNGGTLDGSANLSISGSNLTLSGNFNVSNVSASGGVIASTITGPLLTNAQPNITSVGTLISLSVTGTANVGNVETPGRVSAAGNVTGANLITSGVVTATGNANVGNLGTTTAIITTGNITTINSGNLQSSGNILVNSAANVNITAAANIFLSSAGNANVLIVTGTGANIAGTVSASGNANVGNLGTAGLITVTGNVTAGNLITGGLVSVTGNVSANNFVANSYTIQSVLASQTATGTNQGTALAVTKSIIECTTVASGTGVVLPTAIAGMTITVVNGGLNALNVYPASGAVINSLATNGAYSLAVGARLQFFATSSTKWYTLNATYA